MTNTKYESATGFAGRVSGSTERFKGSGKAGGGVGTHSTEKRRAGALRGEIEHNSFDVAARRHYSEDALHTRRVTSRVLLLVYATVGVVLYGLYILLAPLR